MTSTTAAVPVVEAGRLLGSARQLQRDQLGTYLTAMATYGDHVRFRVGPPRVGFVFDAVFRPEGARQVLASRTYRYVKDAPAYEEFAHLFGAGLAVSEGQLWRSHRRLLQPLFTPRRVAASLPQISQASAALLAEWQAALPAGTIELTDTALRYAIQALSRTVFGGDDVDDTIPVLRDIVPVLSEYATRRGLAAIRLPRALPTPANRRAEHMRRALYGVVDELTRRRRNAEGEDLLSRLLTARDPETGEGLDAQQIRDEVLIFLVAGFETTATALSLTLHLLGRHPGVQERVRAEVNEVLPEREPDADDLERLTYTAQVLQEVLRLYPPLHTLVRRAVDGGELLGSTLPPGHIVAVSAWGIHRNPEVWPDPDRFDPERFEPEAVAARDRFAHLPFGAGPRSCIGVHLALTELLVAVAAIVRSYRLQSVEDAPNIEAGLTLRPVAPLRCRIEPVDNAHRR